MTARLAAIPFDLPVAGLQVELDDDWTVESTWGPAGGADWLSSSDGRSRYRIEVGGRTERDCPMASPVTIEVAGETWIQDGQRLCRTFGDARLEVERHAERSAHEEDLLVALAKTVSERRLSTTPPPPPSATVEALARLPLTGLSVQLPVGTLWRVAKPIVGRDFDALVRTVPAFPEVQVVVRRHARSELASCEAAGRRLMAGTWRAHDPSSGDISKIEEFIVLAQTETISFVSHALCMGSEQELLDVRVASRPHLPVLAHALILGALANASPGLGLAPLPSDLARRDAGLVRHHWSVLTAAAQLEPRAADAPSRSGAAVGLDAGLGLLWKNGLAATIAGSVGVDRLGPSWGASVDVGVAFKFASDLVLVLSLGWLERHEALIDNRALTLSFGLHRGYLASDGKIPWSLRVVAFQLASRVPQIMGAPLEIVWQGELWPGLVGGLSWRSVSQGVGGSDEGIELGIRFGIGSIWR